MDATEEVARRFRIDPSKVPERVEYDIAKTLYRSIVAYFDKPGTKERFEAWKAERDAMKEEG